MLVKQLVNSIFESNTYIISDQNSSCVWVIDIGDIEGVINNLPENSIIKGVFLTHEHFDHIFGINKLIELFPKCLVFTSDQGKHALRSSKLNLSFYHEIPIEFQSSNTHLLKENDKIEIFENIYLEAYETPGHTASCLTYKVSEYLFTGDSFIPGIPVVTKLKGGSREESRKSLRKIESLIKSGSIICPGHGPIKSIDSSSGPLALFD